MTFEAKNAGIKYGLQIGNGKGIVFGIIGQLNQAERKGIKPRYCLY